MGSGTRVDGGSLRAVTRARNALDAATAAYRRTLIDARDSGSTCAEIAAVAGMTRQGVWKATGGHRNADDSRAQHTRPGTGGRRRA